MQFLSNSQTKITEYVGLLSDNVTLDAGCGKYFAITLLSVVYVVLDGSPSTERRRLQMPEERCSIQHTMLRAIHQTAVI